MKRWLHRHFPGLFPANYQPPLEPIRSLDDRLDFACMQLVICQERTGKVTADDVLNAADDWSDEGNGEQWMWLKLNLMEMVTA